MPSDANAAATGPAAPPQRLFIALMPDAGALGALDAHCQGWHWPPGCRITRGPRVHLTLHFLGKVEPARAQSLRQALAEVAMAPFALKLAQPEVWPRPRVAVLRPETSEALRTLRHGVVRAVARSGLDTPREDWTPHLTLARNCPDAVPPDTPAPVEWTAREFVLVHSMLAPRWRHEVVARYPLPADTPATPAEPATA